MDHQGCGATTAGLPRIILPYLLRAESLLTRSV